MCWTFIPIAFNNSTLNGKAKSQNTDHQRFFHWHADGEEINVITLEATQCVRMTRLHLKEPEWTNSFNQNSFRPSGWKITQVNFSKEFLIGCDIWQYVLVTFEDETFPAYFSFHGHIFVVHRKCCWWRHSNCGSRLSDMTAYQLDPKLCPSNKPFCTQQRSWESIVYCHMFGKYASTRGTWLRTFYI